MSERKVLQKYFPPDFDPSKIQRQKGKNAGPKSQLVRLMAPFSLMCLACGEYIYKGRKFNAKKQEYPEKYLNAIQVYSFHIKCTRCAAPIEFKTDPKNMDYEVVSGARRNFEPWRKSKLEEETEEQMLDRLAQEEADRDAMKELETKVHDAKQEMAIADALDEIQSRNARIERSGKEGARTDVPDVVDEKRKREEEEDAEAARMAFENAGLPDIGEEIIEDGDLSDDTPDITPVPTFVRQPKPKKDPSAALGIRKKAPVKEVPKKKPALVVGYDSDSD